MRIVYFDCFSGASGDMVLGGLLDAGASLDKVKAAIKSLGLENVQVSTEKVQKNGFRANQLRIVSPPEHAHRHLSDISSMIEKGDFSTKAKQLALSVFRRVAVAEAHVHGCSINEVHFHEVGAVDSIADIVGTAVAWEDLGAETAYASAIPLGDGHVKIAHGIVSLPAPATAEILRGIPIAPTNIQAELTTPTGAAILAELVTGFGPLPSMQIERIGYGAGTRDLEARPNLLRVFVGEALRIRRRGDNHIAVLETNLDDISGEQIGFTIERLWAEGALDVFTAPVQMKKGRPGVLLTVLCQPVDRKRMENILFQQTGTLGIRFREQERSVLKREFAKVQTPFGEVSGKVSYLPNGEIDFSPEYDDCKNLAERHGQRLAAIVDAARAAFARLTELEQVSSTSVAESSGMYSATPTHDHSHSHSHSHSHDHGHTHSHSHSHTHSHDHPHEDAQPVKPSGLSGTVNEQQIQNASVAPPIQDEWIGRPNVSGNGTTSSGILADQYIGPQSDDEEFDHSQIRHWGPLNDVLNDVSAKFDLDWDRFRKPHDDASPVRNLYHSPQESLKRPYYLDRSNDDYGDPTSHQ